MTERVLDLFAGPGGWDLAAEALGLRPIGVEKDEMTCATRRAAGLLTIRADVATLDPSTFGPVDGLIASPPCPAFSAAGDGRGARQIDELIDHVGRVAAAGRWLPWEGDPDPGVWLVLEPLRWTLALRPTWMAWEQVPPVAPLWEACLEALRGFGWRGWSGVLCAADYGTPQTRTRAFLIARRDRAVQPPEPTHAKHPQPDLFRNASARWVSMAEALGWTDDVILEVVRGAGMLERFGDRPTRTGDEPAFTVTAGESRWGGGPRWRLSWPRPNGHGEISTDGPAPTVCGAPKPAWLPRVNTRRGQEPDGSTQTREADETAPTVTAQASGQWALERPATTVMGDSRIWPPGHHANANEPGVSRNEGALKLTIPELGVLQDFPIDYPWQGNKSQQSAQVGNAVPPRLARAVLDAVTK